jgi:hypothetical protein
LGTETTAYTEIRYNISTIAGDENVVRLDVLMYYGGILAMKKGKATTYVMYELPYLAFW